MNNIWLCITSLLAVTLVFSDGKIGRHRIVVFPGENQSIAGVFLVSHLNSNNNFVYAFNASEARRVCIELGVHMASKDQVERALTRGLETCRFGWIDEHFAVIPRIHPLGTCGKSQTGLVPWRASVTKLFDVFCYNELDAATQLMDLATDSPLNSSYASGRSQSPQETLKTSTTSSTSFLPSSSSSPKMMDSQAQPVQFVGSAQRSSGGKLVLITCTSSLLILAIVIIAHLKLHRHCYQGCDVKQQQEEEHIETGEWTCVKAMESQRDAQPDERIELEDEEQ